MFATFPELLFLSTFAPLLIRLALVAVLALTAWEHATKPSLLIRGWAFVEVLVAVGILVGAWTQPAALAAAVWLMASLFVPQMRTFPKSTVVLALVMALTLVVTGPGAFSFDLPL